MKELKELFERLVISNEAIAQALTNTRTYTPKPVELKVVPLQDDNEPDAVSLAEPDQEEDENPIDALVENKDRAALLEMCERWKIEGVKPQTRTATLGKLLKKAADSKTLPEPDETLPEPEAAIPIDDPFATPKTYTDKDILAALQAVHKKSGTRLLEILTLCGVSKVKDIPEDKYNLVMGEVNNG